jgi:hypothetical protein
MSVKLGKGLSAFGIQVLVEQGRVDEALVKLFALIDLAAHKLAAESVFLAQRF